jgi:hypothetical protein
MLYVPAAVPRLIAVLTNEAVTSALGYTRSSMTDF